MTCNEFWLSVLSNFISTLIAGLFLGAVTYAILEKKARDREKKTLHIENDLERQKKKLEFIECLKFEIEDIYDYLKVIMPKFQGNESWIEIPYVNFDISLWEVYKTGGEIPLYFSPIVLQVITNFYSKVNQCNLIYEKMFHALINNNQPVKNLMLIKYKEELHSVENINTCNNIIAVVDEVIAETKLDIQRLHNNLSARKA